MPEQKGRKRKPVRNRREHARASDGDRDESSTRQQSSASSPCSAASSTIEPPLPSRGVRLAAVAIAIVTAAFAVGLFYSALIAGNGVDLAVKLAGSVILLALAIVIAALLVCPPAIVRGGAAIMLLSAAHNNLERYAATIAFLVKQSPGG